MQTARSTECHSIRGLGLIVRTAEVPAEIGCLMAMRIAMPSIFDGRGSGTSDCKQADRPAGSKGEVKKRRLRSGNKTSRASDNIRSPVGREFLLAVHRLGDQPDTDERRPVKEKMFEGPE